MTNSPGTSRHHLWIWGVACAGCLMAAGCSDPSSSAGVSRSPTPSADRESFRGAREPAESDVALAGSEKAEEASARSADSRQADSRPADSAATEPAVAAPTVESAPAARDRVFAEEGPEGALRISYDDLDLLKILKMDPVTPDCVEKMPDWLLALKGKTVRIRGFMKPGLLLSGIPQFMLVRDTGLCCFGPKGKIYDMVAVTLKPGTTTEYIELRPFDVVGTFRIELLQLEEDGTIFGLYYIDDAVILQK